MYSKELKDFLLENKQIQTVYFDASGRHYFNVFTLREDKDDKNEDEYKKYGRGEISHYEVIKTPINIDDIRNPIFKGDKSTLIVKEVAAQDIIEHEEEEKIKPSAFIEAISSLSKDELEKLTELLKITLSAKENKTEEQDSNII